MQTSRNRATVGARADKLLSLYTDRFRKSKDYREGRMASARRECVLFFCVGPNLTDGFIFFCSFFFFLFLLPSLSSSWEPDDGRNPKRHDPGRRPSVSGTFSTLHGVARRCLSFLLVCSPSHSSHRPRAAAGGVALFGVQYAQLYGPLGVPRLQPSARIARRFLGPLAVGGAAVGTARGAP